MELESLVNALTSHTTHGTLVGRDVRDVTTDSRAVRSGSLFVAIRGVAGDGHAFIDAAVAAGAVAVCGEDARPDLAVPYIQVPDSRDAAAQLAEAFHDFPARALHLVGITGTNGKTSTATLVRTICDAADIASGIIGTVQYDVGGGPRPASVTTPGPMELSTLLAEARAHHKQMVVLEVSSHALDQARVGALEFDVAVFTNCTQDHLDYHGDMESYFAAKRRLFEDLGLDAHKAWPKRAIVNADDPHATQVAGACLVPVWTYGIHHAADIHARDIQLSAGGTRAQVATPAGPAQLELQLLGEHNVSNALAALGVALALEIPLNTAVTALNAAPCVPGRCESVDAGQAFGVLVDYAHTPDGIRALLEAARALDPKRLIVVFGCGGDRDRTKRPQMGELVAQVADAAVVTSDNPRTEDPTQILLDIEVGVQRTGWSRGEQYDLIEDRRAAIAKALAMAQAKDLVVIAGKGHEDYQIIGTERRHFDDREVARELLGELGGGAC